MIAVVGRDRHFITDESALFDRFEYLKSVRKETVFNIYSGFRVWADKD